MLKFARHQIARRQPERRSPFRFAWVLVMGALLIGESAAQESSSEPRRDFVLRPVSTWEGHSDQVRSVAFSPGGERAVTGSFDGTVRVWDVRTGKPSRTLFWGAEGESGPGVRKVAFSPDGKRLLRAGGRGRIAVDDLEQDSPRVEHTGHRGSIWAAAFSPDGKRIVSGDQNGLVRCWNSDSGELIWQFTRQSDTIYDLNYSSDGRWILSCAKDGSASLIDAPTGQLDRQMEQSNAVLCGVISPESGRVLTMGYGNEHRLWNRDTGASIRRIGGINQGVFDVVWLPGGFAIAAASDGTLRVLDLEHGRQLTSFRAHRADVWSIAVSPDGKKLLSASGDGTVRLWQLSHDALLQARAETVQRPLPDSQNGLIDYRGYSWQISGLMWARQFSDLEAVVAKLRRSPRTLPSGHSMLRGFYNGTVWFETDERRTDNDYRRLIGNLEAWREAYPDSLAARLSLAQAWQSFAWNARGGSWASRVDPEDWGQFRKRIAKAEEVLADITEEPDDDPHYYYLRTTLARDQGRSKEKIERWTRRSAEIDPTYWHTFGAAANYLMRRYFGQSGDAARMAATGAELTEQDLGWEVYTRVAIVSHFDLGGGLFRSGGFGWEETRRGFADALRRSPGSVYLWNQYALLACVAGDRETASHQFTLLRGRWDGSVWQNREDFELWRRWASPQFTDGEHERLVSEHAGAVLSLAYSPGGELLVSGGQDKQVCLHTLRDESAGPRRMDLLDSASSVAFSPDGRLIAAGTGSGLLTIWDVATGEQVSAAELEDQVEDLVFSPDGDWFAAASRSGKIQVWPSDLSDEPRRLGAAQLLRGSFGIDISPDSKRITAVDGSGKVIVWELESGKLVWSRHAHEGGATDVAFSPDGTMVASSGKTRVKLWNAEDGEAAGALTVTPMPIEKIQFTPDSQRIAGVTLDHKNRMKPGTLHVWDVNSLQQVDEFSGHRAGVSDVSISPDGQQIATASADRSIRFWAMPESSDNSADE